MIDHFALLGENRRPWIDPELLKKKFLILSAEFHPDRVHGHSAEEMRAAQQRFTEVNQAYNSLRHPKGRLQHLLELELGVKPQQVEQIPPDLMEFFIEVGRLFQQVDKFLAQRAQTSSPLLQVQFFEPSQLWIEKLNELHGRLRARQQSLMAELRTLDLKWVASEKSEPASREGMVQDLEKLYRLFSYYAKWEGQVQERVMQLSL